jgi:glycosyltransferase involved in cell wall biosynthesis
MIRVIQLLDRDADVQSQRGADALTRGLGPGFSSDVREIGRGGYRDVIAGVLALRRDERFDVIHAWGRDALATAAMSNAERIVYTPATSRLKRSIAWTRAVMDYRSVEVICPTSTLRRLHVERGVPLDRCHLIRPGVDFARVKRRRDDALRERLGLMPEDRVLLAVGESTRAAAHDHAAWATSILHVVWPTYKLLYWGRGPMAAGVARLGKQLRQPQLVVNGTKQLGPIEFEALLPAADVVLISARGPVATLPISIAMAAGLPIVATVSYTVGELLEDRHTALLAPANQPRQLARRVLDLEADRNLQWTISDMARTEAYEFFPLTRFIEHHRVVYSQVAAGDRVEVPQPTAGAGLRFHGRV